MAYGGGGQFALSVAGLADLAPSRVLYFGDLDAEGLAIPQRAIAAAEQAGLPAPEPAIRLWSALCDLADRYGQSARPVPDDVAVELCSWISDGALDEADGPGADLWPAGGTRSHWPRVPPRPPTRLSLFKRRLPLFVDLGTGSAGPIGFRRLHESRSGTDYGTRQSHA